MSIYVDKKTVKKHIDKLVKHELPQTDYFKRIKANLNYRDVRGYISNEALVKQLALQLYLMAEIEMPSLDHYQILLISALEFIYRENIPCYWVKEDLIRALINTELPKHWVDLKPFVPKGLFILPQGLIKNTEGVNVNWIYFQYYPQNYLRPKIELKVVNVNPLPYKENCFQWVSHSKDDSVYCSTISLTPDENGLPKYRDIAITDLAKSSYKQENITEDDEANFIKTIDNLCFQLMLYMMAKPDSIVVQSGFGTKGTGKSKSDRLRNPVWIGKNFKIKRETSSNTTKNPGSSSSKITHWRRGHWRNQPIGKRDKQELEYKQIWIEPVLING
ncbi:MAG: hypothetical protein QNJ54_30265 [Prochloraceae cyanobacterium]|nr:hypothetical protein [Prochloraceae cyanobacterium]